jgi:hypothetical protein
MEVIENHRKATVRRQLANTGKHLAFGNLKRVAGCHASRTVDDVGKRVTVLAGTEELSTRTGTAPISATGTAPPTVVST